MSEFVRAPVRAVPRILAARLGPCLIRFVPRFRSAFMSSRWRETAGPLQIEIAVAGREPHDLAMEMLICFGQILWPRMSDSEGQEFLDVLRREMDAGVTGEIDEDVVALKRRLLSGRRAALNPVLLDRYCLAAFASTCAEFVHALWHDVTVHTGPDHLDPQCLRRRLELFARWFPPDRGYRLFPR